MSVPEFSHIVNLRDLSQNGADYDISAGVAECAGLAQRFGLVRLGALNARLRLGPRARGVVRLSGRISARVTQTCVATLDPVEEEVEIDLDIVFQPDAGDDGPDGSEFDGELDIESFAGDTLDIGEIVAVEMALSLNPYPRAATAPPIGPLGGPQVGPQVGPQGDGPDVAAGATPERPFAGLGALIQKRAKN